MGEELEGNQKSISMRALIHWLLLIITSPILVIGFLSRLIYMRFRAGESLFNLFAAYIDNEP
jgi:hypothetical protein